MSTGKLFIGKRVRELRQENGATQAQFAERIGISTSYLNQIESNQRPVSATVLLALVDKCGLNVAELGAGETDRLLSAFSEALSDPLFQGYAPGIQELKMIVQNAPGLAHALIAAHQAYRRTSEQLASIDRELAKGASDPTPYEEVRDFFHFTDNYIHELDIVAETIAVETGIPYDSFVALKARLEGKHGVSVRQLTQDGELRRFDRSNRTLYLSGNSPLVTQQFQLAIQLAQLEASPAIDAILSRASFRTQEAVEICRVGLQNYFAGALLMPYEKFARSASELRHDVELIALRFGTSLEQTCHRLSTLQRPGNKGVPVFFARIDRAGNITKRHSATRLQFARYGAACPLWNAHTAFETQGRIIRQLAQMPDGSRYLSMAVQVTKRNGGYRSAETVYVLAFGCDISVADAFVYADGLDIKGGAHYEPIGVSCRVCERQGCHARATPPVKRRIEVNHAQRGVLPYELV
ncbi:helix-turn-helix domain-containing protein [Limoniibacter endophyticus]|uniref:Cro/Cl family transcriptional regulator n=1 Tax=Limoniibacter endophyticus TaxID=1565040 RepID=A0A8J3DKV9_9HYPH|nr:helix-turn-helix transcriptional regulator [Limoniibacter endophyticus]GHC78339.1 Cro/Cl family transcriptional regulator [Limoniibacter endophyticus]